MFPPRTCVLGESLALSCLFLRLSLPLATRGAFFSGVLVVRVVSNLSSPPPPQHKKPIGIAYGTPLCLSLSPTMSSHLPAMFFLISLSANRVLGLWFVQGTTRSEESAPETRSWRMSSAAATRGRDRRAARMALSASRWARARATRRWADIADAHRTQKCIFVNCVQSTKT